MQAAAWYALIAVFHLLAALDFGPGGPDRSPMPLWLFWLLLGLIAGSLAKFIMPGRDPAGCIFTIALGIIGALLGGMIGTRLGWGTVSQGALDFRSIGIATFGALLLLIVGRLARRTK
jgi:uncharacterized membrane protein YeaQ/YmgE (transglycosylase-associated protein family)